MLDMLEGTLPSISEPKKNASPADVALYEEERRLFYVGMTRAKKSLYIFTFKESETSAFSKVVFGIESGAQNKPIVGKELQKKLLDYEQGIALIHQKFGQGAVVNRKDNYVDIYFTRTGETKKIALEYAVANGIIRLK